MHWEALGQNNSTAKLPEKWAKPTPWVHYDANPMAAALVPQALSVVAQGSFLTIGGSPHLPTVLVAHRRIR